MRQKKNKIYHKNITLLPAQTFVEYAIVIALVSAVLIVMGVYFSRALQGRLKESVDPIGEEYHRSVPLGESGYRLSGVTERLSSGMGVVHSNAAVSKGTFTFSHEGEKGFEVSTRASHRNEISMLRGTATGVNAPGLNPEDFTDLEQVKALEEFQDLQPDPGSVEEMEKNLEDRTKEHEQTSGDDAGLEEDDDD